MRAIAGDVAAPGRVMSALADAVTVAAYWQPPDDEDVLISSREVVRELLPAAERLLDCAAAEWWSTPLRVEEQCLTEFLHEPTTPVAPRLPDPRDKLNAWRADQLRSNADFRAVRDGRAQRSEQRTGWSVYREPGDGPAEDYARLSGTWWSTPNRWDVPPTARELPGVGPVALWLTEDEMGWTDAHCWPVAAAAPARVYEINRPQAWADLVAQYPLDVADSRRPDWARATGRDGAWLIPDWPAVATEYDAVHLSVLGYLTTAGMPIGVGADHVTLLAGWDPDATYWLTDAPTVTGRARRWVRDEASEWKAR